MILSDNRTQIHRALGFFRAFVWHLRNEGYEKAINWARYRLRSELIPYQAVSLEADGISTFSPIRQDAPFRRIKVASILDDFSRDAWAFEFDLFSITRSNWRETIDSGVDFLLVEAAWSGNRGEWRYALTGGNAPRSDLIAIVRHCRSLGIPTVFWNKEDPPHFNDFLETAKLFDVVFTTDSEMIPRYRDALAPDVKVDVLEFAAQTAIHSPVRAVDHLRTGDVAFAGMYFSHKFPSRREQMDLLLGGVAQVAQKYGLTFTIYSRMAGDDERYQFPDYLKKYVVGSLAYSKMLTAYRLHKVFLNVNSVTSSPTMCARRVFEVTASGGAIVSTSSAALERMFNEDEIALVDSSGAAIKWVRALVNSGELRQRMVHKAQRKIWAAHTYTHRAVQILDSIDIDSSNSRTVTPQVSVVISTKRPDYVERILELISVQNSVSVQVVLATHGFEIDSHQLAKTFNSGSIDDFKHLSCPENWSLGRCLNEAIARTDGPYCAKIDDDDFYGSNYLLDEVNALRFSGADLVGKEAAYMYLSELDVLLLRKPDREHRFTQFVSGPTLLGTAALFKEHRFADRTTGEDSQFLADIARKGAAIYSSDRFNFIQVRRGANHTWEADELDMLANGVMATKGFNVNHVVV